MVCVSSYSNPCADKHTSLRYFAPFTPTKKRTKRKRNSILWDNSLDGPKIRKLFKISCRRALDFDSKGPVINVGIVLALEATAFVRQRKSVTVPNKQACPLAYDRRKGLTDPCKDKHTWLQYFAPVTPTKKRTKRKRNFILPYNSPDGPIFRKMSESSCRRALNFDFKAYLIAYERRRKELTDQSGSETVQMSKGQVILPIVYTRRQKAQSVDQSNAEMMLVKKRQFEKELHGQILTYFPNVAHQNVSGGSWKNYSNQMLILHRKEGIMVPHAGLSRPVDPRLKVHLNEETYRVWRLLLADSNSPEIDGINEENKKWWEKERMQYQQLADIFVSRMHLVQGDRQFSQWKGSVVDSVVGAFLTQNVADFLSSSAFMGLASKFPPKSNVEKSSSSEMWTINDADISHGSLSASSSLGETKIESETNTKKKKPTKSNSDKELDGMSKLGRKKNPSKKNKIDWDRLKREFEATGRKRERLDTTRDSVDWEAVRSADVNEISQIIRNRGMHDRLAKRIQDFLNRIARDHGSIDLEWLRDLAPDKAKEYLLSIYGMGLKSVECIRLLTFHQCAFPVDTNVARVAVRLGWVPLQPLPESVQLHLLTLYPILQTIQIYLWPRLCKLDQRTLYELHYQMITFGKVFCTKLKPNCNACPMRGDCRHYASAYDASSRLALQGNEDKSTVNIHCPTVNTSPMGLTLAVAHKLLKECQQNDPVFESSTDKPIIELPLSPEPEHTEASEIDIEDTLPEESDDFPETIELNGEDIKQHLQNYIDRQDWEMSQALVALTPEVASIPMPKLKNVNKLRTQHQVYELPDSHHLLTGLEKREPDDPCKYLLAIWTAGETAESIEASASTGDADSHTVRGTLLIPCRTALKGSFPLNGTYFQVNEVFADDVSSKNPIIVPRESLWYLTRRTVYFGTSISTIFRGFTTEEIQRCFWRGYVCVRAFDRQTRAPRPLVDRLHFSPSKYQSTKSKMTDKDTVCSASIKSKIRKDDKEAKQKSFVKPKIQGHALLHKAHAWN